jgi:phytoene dehydrogenase-like protein
MAKRVIINGGSVKGLAAAVRLAGSKMKVTLLEESEQLSGGNFSVRIHHPARDDAPPFVFDVDPWPLTTPYLLLDLFAAAGLDVRDHLKIVKIDPVKRYCWPDGICFDHCADEPELFKSITAIGKDDLAGWMRLLARGRRIWTTMERMAEREANLSTRRRFIDGVGWLNTIVLQPTAGGSVDRYLHHPKLREVWHYELGCFVDAISQPDCRRLAQRWLEHEYGLWHIVGGMHVLVEQLEKIARNLGVEIRCNCPVEGVIPRPKTLAGPQPVRGFVLRDGTELLADAIIPAGCYRGCGYSTLFLGVEGDIPLPHRTTIFLNDGQNASSFVEVACPTRTDPSLAPENCHTLIVQSLTELRRDDLVQLLEQRLGLSGLNQRIVAERFIALRHPIDDMVRHCVSVEMLQYGKADSDSVKQYLA